MDPRSAKTVATIKRVFLELIETTPISKVSISTLCTKVGIPRQTFYYHFDDMQALIDAVIQDEVDGYNRMFKDDTSDFITKTIRQMQTFGRNNLLNQRLTEAGMGDMLRNRLFEASHEMFIKRWTTGDDDLAKEKAEVTFRFIGAGMYEVMFNRADNLTDEELATFIYEAMQTHHLIPKAEN